MDEVINFASDEERYFYWWCQELIKEGFIKEVTYEPNSFELTPPVKYTVTEKLKTKTKPKSEHILAKHSYTPDFLIKWNNSAIDKLFKKASTIGNNFKDYSLIAHSKVFSDGYFYSYVEVKPTFDQHNMTREAQINIKMLHHKYNILVNLVKIGNKKGSFFDNTFTPQKYLFTDKTKRKKVLKYKPIMTQQYLEKIRLLNITRGIYGTTIELF